MKTKTSLGLTVLSVFTVFAILSPSVLAATTTTFSSTNFGVITDAGNQHYVMSGGYLVSGEFMGTPLSTGSISFNLDSQVTGLKTSGSASISIPGLSANMVISGEIPIQTFPLTSPAPTSEVPLYFTGIAVIHASGLSPLKLPVAIESAYWNPFGGPIVITSLEGNSPPDLLLIATYNVATIDWIGVQVQGTVTGFLGGSTSISGYYASITNSHEDLVNAIEQDHGMITFSGMSAPQLDGTGIISGTTTFSSAGSIDCSSLVTMIPGTCLFTGASSSGSFNVVGQQGVKISGTFSTSWSVPSLSTMTLVTAIVTQP